MKSKYEFEKEEEDGEDKNNNSIETIKIKMKGYNTQRYLRYPIKLCEFIINTIEQNQDEIIKIIEEIKGILYQKPYPILFGRINTYTPKEAPDNINSEFYEGIGLNDIS